MHRKRTHLLLRPFAVMLATGLVLVVMLLAGRIDFLPMLESAVTTVFAQVHPDPSPPAEAGESSDAATATAERKIAMIGVYKGPGSWDIGVEAVDNFLDHYGADRVEIDSRDVDHNRLSGKYDAIWFPGGWADQYREGVAVDFNLIDYVRNGGIFIGSCAGAYYFCELLRQQEGGTVLPVDAVESVVELIGWGTMTTLEPAGDNGPGLAAPTEMLYAGGPYFTFPGVEKVTVIANYSVNGEPAVVYFRLGEGMVLLIGPHPELGFRAADGIWNLAGGDGAQWDWLQNVLRLVLGSQDTPS